MFWFERNIRKILEYPGRLFRDVIETVYHNSDMRTRRRGRKTQGRSREKEKSKKIQDNQKFTLQTGNFLI